jgi:uncharacterized coiled-coil protein SlyX
MSAPVDIKQATVTGGSVAIPLGAVIWFLYGEVADANDQLAALEVRVTVQETELGHVQSELEKVQATVDDTNDKADQIVSILQNK